MLKKIFVVSIIGFFSVAAVVSAETLAQRLSGTILLQVEANGEAWYIDPVTLQRGYLKDGAVAYSALREFGLGIKNADLNKIPVGVESRFSDTDTDNDGLSDQLEEGLKTDPAKSDTDGDAILDGWEVLHANTNPLGAGSLVYDTALVNRLKGRILLQVESHGESWYLNPKDGKRYYMKDGDAAYQIMRFLSLGITNANLALIPVNPKFDIGTTNTGTQTNNDDTMTRGTADPDFSVNVYDKTKALAGTTLFADNHNTAKPRIIEVNMLGEIIWEYDLPADLKTYTNPGFDVERLANNNILFVCPGSGVYEVNRNKQIVWSYKTTKISHDADRLANGNTIFVFGNNDLSTDQQVIEVNSKGEIVWSWYAKNYFNSASYLSMKKQGWAHTNAVTRLSNGNTLVSPRNFNMVVEVNPAGEVVKTIGSKIMIEQHDPEMLDNGHLIFANHGTPEKGIEIDAAENIVWEYSITDPTQHPVRDVDRLSNGNTLITTTTKIIEVTPDKKIVWEFAIKDTSKFVGTAGAGLGFYKAERIVE